MAGPEGTQVAPPTEVKPEVKPTLIAEVKPEVKAEVPPVEAKPEASLIGVEEPKLDAEGKPIVEPAKAEPIKYAEFKAPEGVTLDPAGVAELTAILGPAQVSQETAQALVDMHVKNLQQVQLDTEKAGEKAWTDLRKQWTDEIKADPEIGGAKLKEVQITIAKALDQFGDPGVKQALTATGADNNPAVVRTFYKMAKALTEGGHIAGDVLGKVDPKNTPLEDRLYPGGPRTDMAQPFKGT